MDRLFRLLAVAAIVVAVPVAAAAQDADANAEAKALTDSFIAGLSGFDESLAGITWFGVYLNDTQNIGKLSLEVVKAPQGSGGVYLIKMNMKIQMGPTAFNQKQEAVLDEKLALVSSREESELPTGRKSSFLKKDGGNWVNEIRWQNQGEETESSKTLSIAIEGPNYKERVSGLLALKKMDLSKAATYAFPAIGWPEPEKGDDAEPKAFDITLRVPEKSDHTHRGNAVKIWAVKVEDETEGETTTLKVGDNGAILEMSSEEAPISMIAGNEEECGKNIAAKKSAVQGKPAKTPAEAVMTYFRVISGELDPDVLDAVMDWKAIRDDMAGDKPEVAAMSPEVLAGIIKGQFRKSAGAISVEQINAIEALLQTEENGDSATVEIPGAGNPFKLAKSGDSWKITFFPH